jgi:hypothetical protein
MVPATSKAGGAGRVRSEQPQQLALPDKKTADQENQEFEEGQQTSCSENKEHDICSSMVPVYDTVRVAALEIKIETLKRLKIKNQKCRSISQEKRCMSGCLEQ